MVAEENQMSEDQHREVKDTDRHSRAEINDAYDPVGRPRLSRGQQIVYLLVGILTGLLALRLLSLLFGANPFNGFVDFIYTVTNPFVAPFRGIFGYDVALGASKFEAETLVAIIVYALLGYLLVKILEVGRRNVHYSN
jgi:hypothetical protein